jgi:hypothetical protein
MGVLTILTELLLASTVLARSRQHVNKQTPADALQRRSPSDFANIQPRGKPHYGGPPSKGPIIEQNAKTEKFRVNGKNIPFVDCKQVVTRAAQFNVLIMPGLNSQYWRVVCRVTAHLGRGGCQ